MTQPDLFGLPIVETHHLQHGETLLIPPGCMVLGPIQPVFHPVFGMILHIEKPQNPLLKGFP